MATVSAWCAHHPTRCIFCLNDDQTFWRITKSLNGSLGSADNFDMNKHVQLCNICFKILRCHALKFFDLNGSENGGWVLICPSYIYRIIYKGTSWFSPTDGFVCVFPTCSATKPINVIISWANLYGACRSCKASVLEGVDLSSSLRRTATVSGSDGVRRCRAGVLHCWAWRSCDQETPSISP